MLLSLSFLKVLVSFEVNFEDPDEILLDSIGQLFFYESLLFIFIILSPIKS